MKFICVALALLAIVYANDTVARTQFEAFVQKYEKKYNSVDETIMRFQTFSANLELVKQMNEKHGSPVFGVTKFMDLTTEEFRNFYLMTKDLDAKHPEAPLLKINTTVAAPSSFDWRQHSGVLTPVKNQEQCGSCWAFSATETIESQNALKQGRLPVLAPQQMVDCDTSCYGCGGGWTYKAYEYIISAGGQDTESSYPYTAQNGYCAFKSSSIGAKISSWNYVTQSQSESTMTQALSTEGPLSICVDASSWQFYSGGVLSNCGTNIDHCVQAIGYDTGASTPYWIVRNSWGTSWGESGYIRLLYGQDTCALAQVVTLPVSSA